MDRNKMREQIIEHEGRYMRGERHVPYKDTVGKLTIGFGRNLDDRGLSEDEALFMLDNDINLAVADCRVLFGEDTFDELTDARQRVLVDMALNMGRSRLSKFVRMIGAVRTSSFQRAADEMVSSKWYGQVGARAVRLERMMRTGEG